MATRGPSSAALRDFQRARRRADLRVVLSLLWGPDEGLLAYDDVRRKLRAVETQRREHAYIPLDAIVGSVGRYQDFTRSFLPRRDADAGRWAGVQQAMTGLEGLPPIEVYRLGEAFFVKDGNHRVSVARQLGAKQIDAYVTEVATRVPFTPDMDQDDLIIAAEFAAFLEQTDLDEQRPEADLRVTAPGQYPLLLEHISVHRYFMGLDLSRPVDWDEAAAHWYDAVYEPVARAIRQHRLLDGFPGRTEADLYLFLSEHRGRLEREFGWAIEGPQLAEGLASPKRRIDDLQERAELLRDPATAEHLVDSLLLCLAGDDSDEQVLAHGLALARSEGATVYGLLLEPSPAARLRFEAACEAAGVSGQLAEVETESLRDTVREVRARARYAAVVVAAAGSALAKALLRRSPKPLLLVTATPPGVTRPLLAYDGGAKANQALFALAYLCVRRSLSPVVLHVERRARGLDLDTAPGRRATDYGQGESRGDRRAVPDPEAEAGTLPRGRVEDRTLAQAGAYLEGLGVRAELVSVSGPVADAIVRVAEERGCDVLFLGSHSRLRWLEEVLGGVLDEVIERTELPIVVT